MKLFSKKEKQSKHDEFVAEYRKLSERTGFDMQAVGFLVNHDGSQVAAQRRDQFNKELNEFLKRRNVVLNFNFIVIEKNVVK